MGEVKPGIFGCPVSGTKPKCFSSVFDGITEFYEINGIIFEVLSFPSFTWERPCGGSFIADPHPSINRSQCEMEFREGQ
jgi:hypothetical protein